MMNNQNQPVFPATPRMGRIAAANRLEKTRAKFKDDLHGDRNKRSASVTLGVWRMSLPEQRQSDRQLAGLVEEGSVQDGTGNESTAKRKEGHPISRL